MILVKMDTRLLARIPLTDARAVDAIQRESWSLLNNATRNKETARASHWCKAELVMNAGY